MKFLQKYMALALAMVVGFSLYPTTEAEAFSKVQVVAGGTLLPESTPQSVVIDGRTYVPLRLASEALGEQVEWESETSTVYVGKRTTSQKQNGIQIFVHGEPLAMNRETGMPWMQAPGYTMVPLRVIAEALGAEVTWQDGIVHLSKATVLPPAPKEHVAYTEPEQATEILPLVHEEQTEGESIFGKSKARLHQMQSFVKAREEQVRAQRMRAGQDFTPFPKDFARLYYELGERCGIRGDLALAQALLETGNFQYGNEVKAWQNNFCGLGATGRPVSAKEVEAGKRSLGHFSRAWLEEGLYGWCFLTPADGVEAHIQHLYSYASAESLPQGVEKLDGRFAHGYRGKAVYWTDLNGKWAVPGHGYGERICNIGEEILKFL